MQVESFAAALHTLLGPPLGRASASTAGAPGAQRRARIVDFGSGTGNLLLPLAAAWRNCEWVAVEMKPQPLELLRARADEAGLTNVTCFQVISNQDTGLGRWADVPLRVQGQRGVVSSAVTGWEFFRNQQV